MGILCFDLKLTTFPDEYNIIYPACGFMGWNIPISNFTLKLGSARLQYTLVISNYDNVALYSLTCNIEEGGSREKINSSLSLTCNVCLILHFSSINCQSCSHICYTPTLIISSLIHETCEISKYRTAVWCIALRGNCLTCSKYDGITLWNIWFHYPLNDFNLAVMTSICHCFIRAGIVQQWSQTWVSTGNC